MCNANASAAKQAGLAALQNGILILLIPPLAIFVGILWLAFRRREPTEGQERGEQVRTAGLAVRAPERPTLEDLMGPRTIQETNLEALIREP
jgi:hypothetical protein